LNPFEDATTKKPPTINNNRTEESYSPPAIKKPAIAEKTTLEVKRTLES
jgi:hypothetical protein